MSLILASLTLLLPTPQSELASPAPAIGDRIAAFEFVDTRYLRRDLSQIGSAKAYVLVFTTTQCPLVGRYLPRLVALDQEYGSQGVRFLSVNVGPRDSLIDIAQQALDAGAAFPFVKDFEGEVVRATGVERTPEVIVLDGEGHLRYRGRIDSQYRLGGVNPDAGRADLREALDQVVAGLEVTVPETTVDGCRITLASEPTLPAPPTFAEDVAPILERHCLDCHRPGRSAPFELTSYEDAYGIGEMMAEVVRQERMPPWFAHERFDQFVNRRGLSPQEKRILISWVRTGMEPGNLESWQPPAFEAERWRFEPDLILEVPGLIEVPPDGYIPYKYLVFPYAFPEDTWVEAVQILPENPTVLHHANLAWFMVGEKWNSSNFITGLVPGGDPMVLDPGTAVLIPKGAALGVQAHYVTTGQDEIDRLKVGLRFAKSTVRKRLRHHQITNRRFEIPARARHHEVRAARSFKHDVRSLGLFVHMHLRGKDMSFVAHYPDGETESLLAVPNYNFDWQISYRWDRNGKRFPQGTRIECIAHYDNSAFNPYNPDPDAAVRFGLQTFHEMMYGFIFFVNENEDLNIAVDPDTGQAQP